MVATSRQGLSFFPFLLIASLGANLFFAGWILGGSSIHAWRGPSGPGAFDERLRESLSQQGAIIMKRALTQVRQQFEAHFADVKSARQRTEKLLSTEPFDRAAFLAENKTERAARAIDQTKADEILADAIAQLSAEDRRSLAAMRLPGHFGGGPPLFP